MISAVFTRQETERLSILCSSETARVDGLSCARYSCSCAGVQAFELPRQLSPFCLLFGQFNLQRKYFPFAVYQ